MGPVARVKLNQFEVHITGIRLTEPAVREVMRSVELSAKIQLSFGEYATGNLARSIKSDLKIHGNQIDGKVGSSLSYAEVAHDGARAHYIFPKSRVSKTNPRRAASLKFYWRKVGSVVHFPFVNHPGMRGKFYLTRPLVVAGARHGMKVVIHPK
jgi:hypothetical protein